MILYYHKKSDFIIYPFTPFKINALAILKSSYVVILKFILVHLIPTNLNCFFTSWLSLIEIAGIDSLSFNIFPYIYFALDKDIA